MFLRMSLLLLSFFGWSSGFLLENSGKRGLVFGFWAAGSFGFCAKEFVEGFLVSRFSVFEDWGVERSLVVEGRV